MDRNEAKKLMRQEMEKEAYGISRTTKIFTIGRRLLSTQDVIEEVESETELGKFLLDDYISYQNGTSGLTDEEPTGIERAHAIALMEEDLKMAPLGWADTPLFDQEGVSWTPNRIMVEVRQGTDFGKRYVIAYLTNVQMLEALLGKSYDHMDDNINMLPTDHEPTFHTNLFGKKNKDNDKAN